MDWPLLASLQPEERSELLSHTTARDFARGDAVVREGEPSNSFHLVEIGHLAVRVTTADGDVATLNVLGPGDSFGELGLLKGPAEPRSATVTALGPARTRALPVTTFHALRRRHPGVEDLLVQLLGHRVEELSARLVEAMYDDLDRRVRRRLAALSETYSTARGPWGSGRSHAGPVEIPITQEHLAQLVGGTRPSVNQCLQGLADRGLIELGRGRITVWDTENLLDD